MLPTLVLVPTVLERDVLAPALRAAVVGAGRLELCGFGPVAAAARTAQLLAEYAPAQVLLVGIAGRLDDRLTVGSAYRFERVACHGVGVGSGGGFRSAEQLGWQQWPGDAAGEPIGDLLACGPQRGPTATQAGLLLTACAAAANPDDVRLRKQLYPDAMAEDMEGYAVALACRLRGVPLDIVRGISNSAGDRDKAAWQTPVALEAAAQLALRLLTEAL
jgi:futalosine hydrolase